MPLASVAGQSSRPQTRRTVIGQVRASRGRAEGRGVAFNLFPAIAEAFPGAIIDIVVETTEAVGDRSQARAPLLKKPRRNGDPAPGALKAAMRKRYRWGAHGLTSGQVEFVALDPNLDDPRHNYARVVEVGGVHTAAQPFLTPTLMEERPVFNAKLRGLESRLPHR